MIQHAAASRDAVINFCRSQGLQGNAYDQCLRTAGTKSAGVDMASATALPPGFGSRYILDASEQTVPYSAEAFDASLDADNVALAVEGDEAALPADEGAAAADFGFGAEAEGDARLL
eukprot:tig00000903_g5532.t1